MPSSVPLRGLRIPDELYLKLKHLAALSTRSYNQQATYILKRFVEEYEAIHGEIRVNADDLYA
jgi:hypothetical protein